ncbi:MAG TPA: metalloregulator ArsR/SmtB family transcription factor [Gemmatimonadaceae bacterium]
MAGEVTVHVSPRFEIFYALQALESGAGERLSDWRREMERRLPARARTEIARAAPSPLMWPLVADALRDEPADLGFPQIITALRSMDRAAFQRAVLAGVFKSPGAVDGLMSGRISLKRTIAAEPESRRKLLVLLGLLPFDAESAATHAFERVVAQPIAYRDEIINVLEMFWQVGFSETWEKLAPQMATVARGMKSKISRRGFPAFASENRLPIDTGNEALILGIHVLPSAFNISRLWAAYSDSHERTRFFVPVLDRTLLVGTPRRANDEPRPSRPPKPQHIDGALVFKALGDTTRYAIVTTLARTPMTSVELARLFKVSKPTISHHVQLLRSANLVREQQTETGTVLSINRTTLERASSAAAAEMFSDKGPGHVVKRSRKPQGSSK